MLRFKSNKIRNEWENGKCDKRLQAIVYFIVGICNANGAERYIKLTDIMRTQAEQEKIYGAGTTKKSVHQFGRGVDFIVEFEDGENEADEFHEILVEAINNAFKHDATDEYQTALFHNVGAGWHIHIQVSAKDQTKVRM